MAIALFPTGGGCQSYKVTEPDVPKYYAHISDESGCNVPANPEVDKMMITVYTQDGEFVEDEGGVTKLQGRAGLIEWYIENVGYDPDEDEGSQAPILDLMDRVASMILLHRN